MSAEEAGRDPLAIVPAKMVVCLLGEPDELREIARAAAGALARAAADGGEPPRPGLRPPDGRRAGAGSRTSSPASCPASACSRLFDEVDADAILSVGPARHARRRSPGTIAALHEAGLRVASILDYSGMAGQEFAARSAAKVRETEDAIAAADRSAPHERGGDGCSRSTGSSHARRARRPGSPTTGDDTLPERVEIVVDAVRASRPRRRRRGRGRGDRSTGCSPRGWRSSRTGSATRSPRSRSSDRCSRPASPVRERRCSTRCWRRTRPHGPCASGRSCTPHRRPGSPGPDDPRRARADADWRDILERIPPWLVSHPYNDLLGDGLPECERTWAFDFRSMTPSAWWRVPMTMRPALPQDPAAQYRIHRMVLQHVQFAPARAALGAQGLPRSAPRGALRHVPRRVR